MVIMINRLRWWVETAGMAMLYPAVLLHELTHYVAGRSVAKEIRLHLDLEAPAVSANWRDDVPQWRLKLAKVAPTIVGIAIAPALLYWLLSGNQNALAVILAIALWGVYTKPSADDLTEPVTQTGS